MTESRWTAAVPLVVAVVLAAGMLWLAGEPFAGWTEGDAGRLVLGTPAGPMDRFPDRFAWSPVPGAESYEIELVRLGPGESADPVFRQRGPTAGLELGIAPGADPGPGRYRWTVRALRGGREIASASREFAVGG